MASPMRLGTICPKKIVIAMMAIIGPRGARPAGAASASTILLHRNPTSGICTIMISAAIAIHLWSRLLAV